ncbi:MAG: UvrB/UvrC motif-containing protein [Pirellulales bacterium]|nr:UvrB/UvrC motif-containing protein [Pirellulales bacterium]
MSKDISHILVDWQYDPSRATVRIVSGDDGRDKVQLRVDLGVLQMEIDGRPDGQQPKGFTSWLEYYEAQQEEFDSAHPDSASYELGGEDCERLWQESVQYYHRYLSFWHLKLFDLCARDTSRNLRLFAFIREHVEDRQSVLQFDQWRPYVILMNTRARAVPLLEKADPEGKRYAEALSIIDASIEGIEEFLEEYEQSHRADQCVELTELRRWRDQVVTAMEEETGQGEESLPTESQAQNGQGQAAPSSKEELRRKMEKAVAAEEFEEAARLRDEIRRLSQRSEKG